jgi:hypothetical protein
MTSTGFEPAILATKRPQTYALDRAGTGIGIALLHFPKNMFISNKVTELLLK